MNRCATGVAGASKPPNSALGVDLTWILGRFTRPDAAENETHPPIVLNGAATPIVVVAHREAELGPSADLDRTRDAFVALARGRLDRAYRLAGLLLGGADEAEDATQDALTRAWQSIGSLRDPAGFDAWFDRILVNVCRDRLRRRGRIRFVALDGRAHDRPTTDPFRRLLDGDELLHALDGLDADHRAVIVLRFWADLTVDDIAARLGWPAGTVKSRLHRALNHLRGRLPADAPRTETVR